jgi:uncharacterized protein YjaZ
MNMPLNPESIGSFPVIGYETEINVMLDKLKNADAWNKVHDAIETSVQRFQKADVPIPEKIVVGIFLGNPTFLANKEEYTGFGGFSGYIQIVIAPNEYNLRHDLQHLKAALEMNSIIMYYFIMQSGISLMMYQLQDISQWKAWPTALKQAYMEKNM